MLCEEYGVIVNGRPLFDGGALDIGKHGKGQRGMTLLSGSFARLFL